MQICEAYHLTLPCSEEIKQTKHSSQEQLGTSLTLLKLKLVATKAAITASKETKILSGADKFVIAENERRRKE
jgi:hypothetical protein